MSNWRYAFVLEILKFYSKNLLHNTDTYCFLRPAARTMALWWLKRFMMAALLLSLADFEAFDVEATEATP